MKCGGKSNVIFNNGVENNTFMKTCFYGLEHSGTQAHKLCLDAKPHTADDVKQQLIKAVVDSTPSVMV